MVQKTIRIETPAPLRILLLAVLLVCAVAASASAQACTNVQTYNTILNSQTGQLQMQSTVASSWSGDFAIALIAILISFIIATLIFMIGAAFKLDKVRNFGIGEFYEAIATAVMVGFFVFIAGILINTVPAYILTTAPSTLNSVNSVLAGQAAQDPYVFTLNGICSTIGQVETLYDYNLNGDDNFNGASGESIPTYWVPWQTTTSTGFAGLAAALEIEYELTFNGNNAPQQLLSGAVASAELYSYLDWYIPMNSLGALLTDLLYLLWGEYYLIIFFSFMAPVLMATGVVFRSFFPIRAFGGMMIAIGMGFYIILPLLFAFIYSQCLPGNTGCPLLGLSTVQNPYAGILSGAPPNISNILSEYWLFFVLYPTLAVSVTYVFITQVANFIGASAQLGGRLRAGFI